MCLTGLRNEKDRVGNVRSKILNWLFLFVLRPAGNRTPVTPNNVWKVRVLNRIALFVFFCLSSMNRNVSLKLMGKLDVWYR